MWGLTSSTSTEGDRPRKGVGHVPAGVVVDGVDNGKPSTRLACRRLQASHLLGPVSVRALRVARRWL